MNLTSVSLSYDDIRDVPNSTSIPAGPLKPVRKLQMLKEKKGSTLTQHGPVQLYHLTTISGTKQLHLN